MPASRRKFIQLAGKGAAVIAGFPAIVPASVFGATAPSNRINVGAIGTGRISRGHDMPGVWRHEIARIVAVCDVDGTRVEEAKALVNGYYTKKTGKPYDGVTTYINYRELLANRDIDAVLISTPDHWHTLIAIDAVEAGKDVYLQKPASLTIAEGRTLSNSVHRSGRIFQIGSQQRSSPQFRYAAELVRNGRIGQLQTVEVGLPGDPPGGAARDMPVPKSLNYEMWLGSTPVVAYTEDRVHPQNGYGRPGWLRCEQFGAGMITGWGAHHLDSAHWAMDAEYTGPIEVWGSAEFPTKGLWDVHGPFKTEALYSNGVRMEIFRTASSS
jgi:predicted dehydrogenase